MKIIKETFFPVVPRGSIRATQNMFWLTQITEEQAIALDNKWTYRETSIGGVWVTHKQVKKTGVFKEFARKSPPSYARQRKYIIAQYEATKELKRLADELDFVMPEDDFCIVGMFPMPKSWTKKKKDDMSYRLHKSKPDADNISKFLLDSMFKDGSRSARFRNDSCVSSYMVVKYYIPDGQEPGISIIEFEKGLMMSMIKT